MKPDWATRLQRTFARKYDAGFAKGLMLGKAVATRDEQERIIGVLTWDTRPAKLAEMLQDLEHGEIRHEIVVQYLITLIKGEK